MNVNDFWNDAIWIGELIIHFLKEREIVIIDSIKFECLSRATEMHHKLISDKCGNQITLTPIDPDMNLPEVYKLIEFSLTDNSLQSLYPEIAKEWDYRENGNLAPDRITAHSVLKVSWMCPLGHPYQATVNNRSNGKGC